MKLPGEGKGEKRDKQCNVVLRGSEQEGRRT